MNSAKSAMFWSAAENGSVRCGLCPHRCHISDGKSGLCGVRENRGGELIASSYGVVSSVALDPIEKKPLYMFHPGKHILSIGGFGCNFQCPFCQNYEISMEYDRNSQFTDEKAASRSDVRRAKRIVPADVSGLAVQTVPDGNVGVAYTYNEPLIGFEFVRDCATLVREAGLFNVLVTNGCINKEPLETLLPYIDAMNIDLKGFTEVFYKKVRGDLETVKETIKQAAEHCHVEITTLVIPGENEDDIEEIAKWLAEIDTEIPLHLSRFFPRFRYSDMEPTPKETILKLCNNARNHLENVFAGNM